MRPDQDLSRRARRGLAKHCAVLLICAVVAGCSSGAGTAVLAELLALEEGATGEDNSSAPSALPPSTAPTQIAERGRYVVPDGKMAVISFVPGIFAVARKSADFTCDTLRLTKDGNETDTDAIQTRTVAVHLQSGAVTFSLPWKDISGRSTIEVTLPHAQINAASGSLFHVEIADQIARITCAQIGVEITTATGDIEIGPGQSCTLGPQQAEPVIADVAKAGGEEAVRIALADDARISQVILARRAAAPPWRRADR